MPSIVRSCLFGSIIIVLGLSIPCSLPCTECSASVPSICLACSVGYLLSDDNCNKCPDGCLQCQRNRQCFNCTGQYFLENSTCKLCSQNCQKCQNYSKCQKCKDGFSLYQNISDGAYYCFPCPNPCADCKIEKNCMRCDDLLVCNSKCISQYLLRKDCHSNSGISTLLIVQISIPVFFFLAVLLFALIRYRKRRALTVSTFSNNSVTTETSFGQLSDPWNFSWLKHGGQDLDFTTVCSICQEKGPNVCTSCRHMFHIRCLDLWTRKRKSCPNCRNQQVQTVRIYCHMCHRNFVQKNLKHCSILRFSKSLGFCDLCKTTC